MTKPFRIMDQEKVEKIAEIVASSEHCFDLIYRYMSGHIGLAELDCELLRLKEIAQRMIEGPSPPDDPLAKVGTFHKEDEDNEPRLA